MKEDPKSYYQLAKVGDIVEINLPASSKDRERFRGSWVIAYINPKVCREIFVHKINGETVSQVPNSAIRFMCLNNLAEQGQYCFFRLWDKEHTTLTNEWYLALVEELPSPRKITFRMSDATTKTFNIDDIFVQKFSYRVEDI